MPKNGYVALLYIAGGYWEGFGALKGLLWVGFWARFLGGPDFEDKKGKLEAN